MIKRSERDIRVLLRDVDELAAIISNAQRNAVRRHRLLGQAVAVWRDDRVVIEIPADPLEGTGGRGPTDR